MADIFVEESFYMGTSEACIIDLTPPVFSGINFLDVESRGQIRAGWSAGTDVNNPIRYEVYIQAATAVGLFNTANIGGITDKLQLDIFTLPDGSFLENGTTYYVGVRAVDAIGNRDSNTINQNVISTGVLTAIDTYKVEGSYSTDETGQFDVSIWANKNGSLAVSPTSVLGTASYEIYDRDGNLVSGMSGSGISANSEGIYVFNSVTSTLDKNYHYEIKATITVDGEARTNFIPITESIDVIDLDGVTYINSSGQLVGSFWVNCNSQVVITGLGTGSYQAYEADGTIITGLSETGIVADSNGFFSVTPFSLPPTVDTTKAYVVKVSVEVAGVSREKYITIDEDPAVFDCKAVFSVNALNQLEASFWATQNQNLVTTGASLGTAAYTVYDKTGAPVVGLTESGLVADSNGLFHSTPIAATLLSDLQHYTAKISITVSGKVRTSVKGFTLLGT
jgi:hypothetical protein